jgi:hypothetical protein
VRRFNEPSSAANAGVANLFSSGRHFLNSLCIGSLTSYLAKHLLPVEFSLTCLEFAFIQAF